MPAFTYPDGFPQNPLDAIEFSYFLSQTDKDEWKEWIKTATPEQQFELVDTLHSMWLENQKNAVPGAFNNAVNDQLKTAGIESNTSNEKSNTGINTNTPIQDNQTKGLTKTPVDQKNKSGLDPNIPKYDFVKDGDAGMLKNGQNSDQLEDKKSNKPSALMNFGSQKYTPSPVLDSADDASSNPFTDLDDTKSINDNTNTQIETEQLKKVEKKNEPPKAVFNVAKIRESATKKALEDIYQSYNEAREKSYNEEKTYRETQGEFMDKVMKVVVNFEQVADFFDSMTQKLLEMNDKLVQQVKDYSEMKSKLTSQQSDLTDQVEEIRRDVDRLYREVKDGKADTRRKIEEIDGQMASFGADAYRQDGILQRLDLIMSRLHKVELNVFRGNDQVINQNQQTRQPQNPSLNSRMDSNLRPSLNPTKPISINVKKD